jgi:hypothetical protein
MNYEQAWYEYKRQEQHFQELRRELEVEMLATGLEFENIKITKSQTKVWSQDMLKSFKDKFPLDKLFEIEYKPKTSYLKVYAEEKPEDFALLQSALTIKENKPTFSWKGE